jgi:hypothetical protein
MAQHFTSPPDPAETEFRASAAQRGGEAAEGFAPDTVPLWLWRGAWIALGSVIGIGVMGVALLSGGLADPPRAGPLIWSSGPLKALAVPSDYSITAGPILSLPATPYTLEITAAFSADSDHAARWEIVWDNDTAPGNFKIVLDGYGFFAVPPSQPDSTPFIHIRAPGQPNRVALFVSADGQGLLRINDEIAWRGSVPKAERAHVQVIGGKSSVSHFVIQHVALYAPLSHP